MTTTSVTQVLPVVVELKLADFLLKGKTGSLTVEILNGRVNAYRLAEHGRIDSTRE